MIALFRSALILLAFAVAPLVPAVTPDTSCGYVVDDGTPACAPSELPAAMRREVEDRTRIFWGFSGLVVLAVTGGLTRLVRHPARNRLP